MPLERRLDSGVIVYGNNDAVTYYQAIIDAFPNLWKDSGVVQLPREDWMPIPLTSD